MSQDAVSQDLETELALEASAFAPTAVDTNDNTFAAALLNQADLTTELASGQGAFGSTAVGTNDNTFADLLLNQPATITDTMIDPVTQSLMFETVDVVTGNVIREEPVGAQLRLQELEQLIEDGSTAEVQATVDIQA